MSNTNFKVNTNTDLDDLFVRRALFTRGGLWLWGSNLNGTLGDNTRTSRSSPVQTISTGTNWRKIATGYEQTFGIKTDGTLWVWGRGIGGMLGTNNENSVSSPVQTVSGGTNWQSIAGGNAILAIKTDGTLWGWGGNTQGELGDNTVTNRSSPVQTISTGTNWKQISCGWAGHSLAIKSDGTLWSWGANTDGQLGDNTRTNRSSPVQTVSGGTNWKQVSCGDYHTVAIKTDGTLWGWGYNGEGELGTNSISPVRYSSPVQTVSGGTDWKQVSCGGYFTTAIKTDGTLWLWGDNPYGQLGDNTVVRKSSPIQTISGGTNWKFVDGGYYFTTAIKTDGTLWVWGDNTGSFAYLGDNTQISKSSPVQIAAGGTNWKTVDAGIYHAAAIQENN